MSNTGNPVKRANHIKSLPTQRKSWWTPSSSLSFGVSVHKSTRQLVQFTTYSFKRSSMGKTSTRSTNWIFRNNTLKYWKLRPISAVNTKASLTWVSSVAKPVGSIGWRHSLLMRFPSAPATQLLSCLRSTLLESIVWSTNSWPAKSTLFFAVQLVLENLYQSNRSYCATSKTMTTRT